MIPQFQVLLNGIISGALYALIACGISIIYLINKFYHFAHGGIITTAAYLLFLFYSMLKYNLIISIVISIVFSTFIGYSLDLIVYREFRKRKTGNITLLIAGFAMLVIFESFIIMLFGADVKVIGFFEFQKVIDIYGLLISPLQMYIIFLSIFLLFSTHYLLQYTKIGKTMRAVSSNYEIAETLGISSERIYSFSMIVGSIIGAVAGLLIGLEQNIEPIFGSNLMIKGFTSVIIGGSDSLSGAILGAFFLGVIENFVVWYLSPVYKDIITFFLLFIFLIFKPEGILGIKKGVKL